MRKLFLFLVVLFLSFQQVTLAAIKEMTSTPDSVYLFSFATSGDDGRSGLRFAWSWIRKTGLKSAGTTDISGVITAVGDHRRKCSTLI